MRSVMAVAALAAGALAIPGYVYEEDVVVETQVVTVTAYGGGPAAAAPHYGHKNPPKYPQAAPSTQPAAKPTQPAAPAYPAPASTEASYGAAPTDYAGKVVYHHNKHRSNHSSPGLRWDDELANCAQIIASSCVYAHNVDVNGGGYGQNIAAGVTGEDVGQVISDMFYNGEMTKYPYWNEEPSMDGFEEWGHMSQIVWKETTHVGCYTQHCPSGLANTGDGVSPYFTVCNYSPPGNYAGQYSDNVCAPEGEPTITGDAPGY